MKRMLILACAAGFIASAAPVRAQQLTQLEHPKLDAKACADRERLVLGDTHQLPDKEAAGTSLKETTGSSLSEKLARTDGVICPPPHLDPDIRAPAPGGGRTPVIPPSAIAPGATPK